MWPNNSELSSVAESSPPDAFMACDVHQLWTAGQVAAKAKSRNGRTELKPSRSPILTLSLSLLALFLAHIAMRLRRSLGHLPPRRRRQSRQAA